MLNISHKGYEQITSLSSAVGLSSIVGNYCLIDVVGQNVRWRADGTDPTASTGGVMVAGGQYEYRGNINNLKFIEETAGAEINVNYYHVHGDV